MTNNILHNFMNLQPFILLIINFYLLIYSYFSSKNLKKYKLIVNISIFISLIYLFSYSFSLYLTKNNVLFGAGVLLFCYGIFASFISSIVQDKFINIFASFLFIIGSIIFLYDSLKNNSKDYVIYSSIFYLLGSIIFIVYNFSNLNILVTIGWFLFLIGRLFIIIPEYFLKKDKNDEYIEKYYLYK